MRSNRTTPQVAGVLCAFICLYYNVPSISSFSPVSFHTLSFTTTGIGNVHPITDHEAPQGVEMYGCTLSLTLALDEVGGQLHALAASLPGETGYPLYRRLGGSRGRSGRVRKISPPPPPGFNPWTVQFVASRYTDETLPAPGPRPLPVRFE